MPKACQKGPEARQCTVCDGPYYRGRLVYYKEKRAVLQLKKRARCSNSILSLSSFPLQMFVNTTVTKAILNMQIITKELYSIANVFIVIDITSE